ncbi:hypothetical protein JJB07_11550 [Tumebacillus sp. ITR2]|uniref:Uncharacterized protein n=1 Tax=Tumebacillus amylolyticus TaxID=2801339 RepID=A0ABS1JAI2_9BACL|nr:hypothetical protein [Tumebacillus amylolyticus]MBL0387286.1 hypothetical protein [Tumebacillus amylolyticus]
MKVSGRRIQAYLNPYTVNQIHPRNPWIPAWWSAAFPGFGHIMLCRYFKGVLLVIWELFINVHAHLNEAIVFSFTGQFQMAKQVLDNTWFLLYGPVYLYAIWDSYRSTMEINTQFLLARHEKAPIRKFAIDSLEINFLNKLNPKLAAFWSALMPGTGHLYCYRLSTGFFALFSWIAVVYQSHLLPSVLYTFHGDFEQARTVLNPAWGLFFPSLYAFSIYDSYLTATEYNKLYEMELTSYLQNNYQSPDFEWIW